MAINVLKDTVLDSLISSVNNALSQTETARDAAVDAKDSAETSATTADDIVKQSIKFDSVITDLANLPSTPADGDSVLYKDGDILTGYTWSDLDSAWITYQLQGTIANIVDNLTSTETDKGLSANQGRVLDEAKSEKETPTVNVSGSTRSIVAADLDKILIMQSSDDFLVEKDELNVGATVGLMKDHSGTVNVTFATDVSAIPSDLTSGFEITTIDAIVWIHQIRTNEWIVLGEDETLQTHLNDTDDPHSTKDLNTGTQSSGFTVDGDTTEDVIECTASLTVTVGAITKPIILMQDGASSTISLSASGVTLTGGTQSTTNDHDTLLLFPIGTEIFVYYREAP